MAKKQPKLSILIPTLPARISTFSVLINNLREQIRILKVEEDVEILAIMDCKGMTIGDKRNKLLELAKGEYVCSIDDDDNVPIYYVSNILKVINAGTKPDCIAIKGVIKFENTNEERIFVHSLKYDKDTQINVFTVGKSPNHLNPVRREIALKVPFKKMNYGEDRLWALELRSKLKTEVLIEQIMYVYFCYQSKSQSHPLSVLGPI